MSDYRSADVHIALSRKKSMAIGLLLTFFLGPLGLFYASILGGLVMLVVSGVILLVTFGIGAIVIVPICMIWAAVSISGHNTACEREARAAAR